MLPFGHISAGYLISQLGHSQQKRPGRKSVIFIIFCALIFDFDFFVPNLVGMPGGTHHYLATHTPLAGVIYWLILYMLLRKRFSFRVLVLGAIAMVSHLVLDDFSYWLTLVGLENQSRPQIFWLFPFDTRREAEVNSFFGYFSSHPYGNKEVLVSYLIKLPRLFYLEIILTITAMAVWINNLKKRSD